MLANMVEGASSARATGASNRMEVRRRMVALKVKILSQNDLRMLQSQGRATFC